MTPSIAALHFTGITPGRFAGDLSAHLEGATTFRNIAGDCWIAHLFNPSPRYFVSVGEFLSPVRRFHETEAFPDMLSSDRSGWLRQGKILCRTPGIANVLLSIERGALELQTPEGRFLDGPFQQLALEESAAVLGLGWFYLLPAPHRVTERMMLMDGSGTQFLFARPDGNENWAAVRVFKETIEGNREEITAIEVSVPDIGIPGIIIHTLAGSFYLNNPYGPDHQFEGADGQRVSLKRMPPGPDRLLV